MYIHSLTPETAVRTYINHFSCFLTLRGAFTYDLSHNCGSSFCITTGLDLGSVSPEYKLIQKKKKKRQQDGRELESRCRRNPHLCEHEIIASELQSRANINIPDWSILSFCCGIACCIDWGPPPKLPGHICILSSEYLSAPFRSQQI